MASGTWTSVATSGAWNTTSNWASSVVASGIDSTASFTSDITGTTIDTTTGANWSGTIGNIVFSDAGGAGSAWTLGSQATITLSRSSGTPTITTATDATISGPIAAGTGTLVKNGGATLTLSGVSGFANPVVFAEGNTTVSANGGTLGIFRNNVTIQTGTLTFTSFNLFGVSTNASASAVTLNTGGTLTNGTSNRLATVGPLTMAGGLLTSGNAQNVGFWTGAYILRGGVTATETSTISGFPIAIGSDTSPTGTFNIASGKTLTVSAQIDNTPNTAFTALQTTNLTQQTGTGTLTLTGANTFTGNVSVTAGTLNANSATALGAASSTAGISVSSGATLSLGGASNITYNSPGRTLTLAGTGVASLGTPGALVIANAVTNTFGGIALTAGTLIRASESGTLTAPVTTNNHNLTFTVASGKVLTLPSTSVIGASTSTVSYHTLSGDTGTAVVSAQNLYTNPTVIGQGTVLVGASSVGSPGSVTSGPLGRGQLTWNGGTLDVSTTATLSNSVALSGNVSFGGTAALTLAGTIALGSNSTIATNGSGGILTLSGVVSGTGFSLTKAGTNTLVLSGANTYTGGTTLAAGIARANVAQNGSTSGPFGASGSIAFTGGTLQYSANNATDYSGRFLTGSNAQWRIDTNGRNVTFATFIASPGTASLVKLGSGTLSLTGLAVGSGGTTVSEGTLSFTGVNRLGSGSVTVNGGTLQWGGSTTQDYSSQLVLQNGGSATLDVGANNVTFASAIGSSSSSTFTKAGSGTLTLQAANTWSGTTTISAGTLSLASVASLGSGTYAATISIGSGAVFSLSSSATQTLSGQITGLGSIAKSGTGNLTLSSSANNYVGGTTLTGSGVLTVGTNSALGVGTWTLDGAFFDVVSSGIAIANTVAVANSNQVQFIGSGALALNGSFVVPSTTARVLVNANVLTINGATTGSGALEVWGPGKTVLTNTGNAHAGGTTVESNAVLEFSSATIPAGNLALTQGTLRWATGNTQDVSSQIASTGSVIFDTNGNNVTLASSFGSASSTVTKIGAGVLTLAGTNTWSFGTTLTAGTIRIGNASALGSGTLFFDGGTIDAAAPGYTVSNILNVDSGTITFAGTAALTLSAGLRLGFFETSKTITTNGSGGALTLAGIVSNATSVTTKLVKAGTNTLKLTNANTYSGGTDIGAGTMQAGNTQAFGTSGTVTLTTSGATLQTLNSVNGKLTVAALTNSAGGTIKIGG